MGKVEECMGEIFSTIRAGSVESVLGILNSDPSLASIHDVDMSTPLHIAASLGNTEIASLLLERGAEVNALDIHGSTPLIKAIIARRIDVARLLLDNKADTEVHLSDSGRTALHIASLNDDTDAVRILLAFHADPYSLDYWGEGEPVDLAIAAESHHVLGLLATYVTSPFFASILRGDIHQVSECVSRGIDVQAMRPSGDTALHWATILGHVGIVRRLIDISPVDHKDNLGKTALMDAAWLTHGGIALLLLAKGAGPNIADKNGFTALAWSARDDQDIQTVRKLLEYGADPNHATRTNRETPTHTWAQYERPDVMDLLLRAGANPNNKDDSRRTPLHIAAENGCRSVVEKLIAAGAPLNERDEGGYTPLHNAVWSNSLPVVKILVHSGADRDVETDTGQTALNIAIEEGYNMIEKFLGS